MGVGNRASEMGHFCILGDWRVGDIQWGAKLNPNHPLVEKDNDRGVGSES